MSTSVSTTDSGSIDPTNGGIVGKPEIVTGPASEQRAEELTEILNDRPVPAVAPVLYTLTKDDIRGLLAGIPANSPAAGLTPESLEAILKANRQEQESRRSVRHSNADHEHKSVFSHPGGDLKQPKAKLTRETYFNNHREDADELTPFEIDCFNAITATCSARGGRWNAKVSADGRRLLVDVPSFTPDERGDLPSLVEILTELAQGPKAVTPVDMLARIAELERIVAAQQAVSA